MFAGPRRIALALTFVLPSAAAAQGFAYAPGTAQYRVVQSTTAAQDIMGQRQEIESSSSQLVTVTLARPSRDTLAMSVVIDTISATNSMGMPTQMIERFIGMKVAAKISPVGALYSVEGPSEEALPNASSMTDAMGRFLPQLRGALAAGVSWTDTTSGKVNQAGMDIERNTVSTFTVEGDTTLGTRKSLKVVRVDSTSMTGTGNSQNGPMTMEGVTKGKSAIFVTPDGTFMGAEGVEEAVLKIVLAANGMEIGVTQSATTRVEKVK